MATKNDFSTLFNRIYEKLEKTGKAKYNIVLSRCPNSNTIMNVCSEQIFDALRNGKIPPTRNMKSKVFPATYVEIWIRESEGISVKPTLDGDNDPLVREKIHLALTGKKYIEKSDPYARILKKRTFVNKQDYLSKSINEILEQLDNSNFYDYALTTLSDFEEKLLQNL